MALIVQHGPALTKALQIHIWIWLLSCNYARKKCLIALVCLDLRHQLHGIAGQASAYFADLAAVCANYPNGEFRLLAS